MNPAQHQDSEPDTKIVFEFLWRSKRKLLERTENE